MLAALLSDILLLLQKSTERRRSDRLRYRRRRLDVGCVTRKCGWLRVDVATYGRSYCGHWRSGHGRCSPVQWSGTVQWSHRRRTRSLHRGCRHRNKTSTRRWSGDRPREGGHWWLQLEHSTGAWPQRSDAERQVNLFQHQQRSVFRLPVKHVDLRDG